MVNLWQPIEQTLGRPVPKLNPSTIGFVRHEVKNGAYWLREGERCQHIAFIERGMFRHYRLMDGREITRWISLENGYCTSLASFVHYRTSEENIVAIQPTIIWQLRRDDWLRLQDQHPIFKDYWIKVLEYLYSCFEDRVWSLLSSDAPGKYDYLANRYPELIRNVPQKYLAEMMGVAPRHLSRIRRQLMDG